MLSSSDRSLMTAAAYLTWEPTQVERYEYWDGEVVAMSGGTRHHNRVSGNAFRLLDDALDERPCDVYIADVKVQVEPGRKYFYPDVVVTCDRRDDDAQVVQFPCLIIEVLSPATEAIDRGVKFSRYRRSSTLQEYVLIQVEQPGVEVFQRNPQGQWVLSEYGLQDTVSLISVNVVFAIADLYRQVQFEPNESRL